MYAYKEAGPRAITENKKKIDMEMSNDTKSGRFKYQEPIDKLLAEGCQLPELFMPNNQQACRFAFSAEGHPNHIPQYMSNPKRMLQDMGKGKTNMSLLSLSCFTEAERAETFYRNLCKAFKNVQNTIGDSLSEGCLTNDDGLMTSVASNGHFDFYEYECCDLNQTFQITKKLVEDKQDENN